MRHRVTLIETRLLLEYNRQIEAKKLGRRLTTALVRDRSMDYGTLTSVQADLVSTLSSSENAIATGDIEPGLDDFSDDSFQWYGEKILAAIEERDPTPNKMYMQWLGRMYARGDVKMEDLNRQGLLTRYHQYKVRKAMRPAFADINQFKTYRDFEQMMKAEYPQDHTLDDKGESTVFYEDADVTVIIPKDRAAACYYGTNTDWCTASRDDEHNRFAFYNAGGPLYIFVPKAPKHKTEKYQLHVSRNDYIQLMDENDFSFDVLDLQTRFPKAFDYCRGNIQQFQNALHARLFFMPEKVLRSHLTDISNVIADRLRTRCDRWDDETTRPEVLRASHHIRSNIDKYTTSVSLADVRDYVRQSRMSEADVHQLPMFFRDPERIMLLYRGAGFVIPQYMVRTIDGDLQNLFYSKAHQHGRTPGFHFMHKVT